MKNILVVIKKQLKDTLKNKTILIQFILFPVITLVMENAISLDGMPERFFTKLFSVMYMGMAPLTSIASIISEEKEKNTLRVLMMANVKPWQYLVGVGLYVWMICMAGALVMSVGFSGNEIFRYLAIMGCGFMVSIFAGACVGIFAKNQMSATSLAMPVMMVFSFAPMLAMFNETVSKFARLLYTQQMRQLLEGLAFDGTAKESFLVILVNAVVLLGLFILAYRKKGLE